MADPLWTSEEIARATGGSGGGGFSATGVSIDSRAIEPGDLFVALAGVRDGHEFVVKTVDRGAAGALVSKPVPVPAVLVEDTFRGLERLGEAARMRAPQTRRGAVTGSVFPTGNRIDTVLGTPWRYYEPLAEDNYVLKAYQNFLEQSGSNALRAVRKFYRA